jgi:hypothetical protein
MEFDSVLIGFLLGVLLVVVWPKIPAILNGVMKGLRRTKNEI